jgi:hypothetical protein
MGHPCSVTPLFGHSVVWSPRCLITLLLGRSVAWSVMLPPSLQGRGWGRVGTRDCHESTKRPPSIPRCKGGRFFPYVAPLLNCSYSFNPGIAL